MRNQILSISISSILMIVIFSTINVLGIVKKISLEEKTKKASLIVIGGVKLIQSRWEEVNGGKRIFTFIHLDVEKYIKGSGERLIEIKVPGGTVGEITEEVEDVPRFTQGEKVILFLKPEFFRIVGWHQGKYTVKNNKVEGTEMEINKFIQRIKNIIDKKTLLS